MRFDVGLTNGKQPYTWQTFRLVSADASVAWRPASAKCRAEGSLSLAHVLVIALAKKNQNRFISVWHTIATKVLAPLALEPAFSLALRLALQSASYQTAERLSSSAGSLTAAHSFLNL